MNRVGGIKYFKDRKKNKKWWNEKNLGTWTEVEDKDSTVDREENNKEEKRQRWRTEDFKEDSRK